LGAAAVPASLSTTLGSIYQALLFAAAPGHAAVVRIVYIHLANSEIAGGQKVVFRHVETLRELGFDAVLNTDAGIELPRWFEHHAPVQRGGPIFEDDVLVIPEDGMVALSSAVASPAHRLVVMCQNPYASTGLELIAGNLGRFHALLAVGPRHAALVRRLLPGKPVELIRCFADERLFRPRAKQQLAVYVPRKRPLEATAVRRFHRILRPDQGLGWMRAEQATEAQMAEALGRASIYLSLSRLESVGMTTLEAMASGCVCAGFTGVGGAEYATPENGFWAPEDDCVAAADALAAAIDLQRAGGPPLEAMLQAGRETARAWSHAVFRRELEEVWSRLAPQARRRQSTMRSGEHGL
jgi:hypothetical protein